MTKRKSTNQIRVCGIVDDVIRVCGIFDEVIDLEYPCFTTSAHDFRPE